jgi:hypothetical protein
VREPAGDIISIAGAPRPGFLAAIVAVGAACAQTMLGRVPEDERKWLQVPLVAHNKRLEQVQTSDAHRM